MEVSRLLPRPAWLRRLTSRFNRAVPKPVGSGPSLALDRHSLGEARVGDPVESLRRFGAVEDVAASEAGDFRFYSRGIWFSTKDGAVDSFGVFWQDSDHLGFLPFAGWIHFAEKRFSLDAATSETDFVECFGVPYWRDRDRRESLLFYEFGEIEWQVEFNRKRQLCALWVVSPPLLADSKQREMYEVTRSWPPRDA